MNRSKIGLRIPDFSLYMHSQYSLMY